MTYIDEMIKERCPNGVKWKELGEVVDYEQPTKYIESITLFWSPWGSKDSGCSKIKIAKVKACCYSTFTLAIYCFMDFATNVKKKKEKAPHTAEIAVKYSHYKILRRSLFL